MACPVRFRLAVDARPSAAQAPSSSLKNPRCRRACVLALVAGVVGIASIGWIGCSRGGEAPAKIRNVVLVSLDTLGARHVGAYGAERETTPNLDGLAADGTTFESVYTQQVVTLTSHATMLTGLYPQVHGVSRVRPARPGATTLAEILKANGFETAAFTGTGGYMKPDFGLGRGFDLYKLGSVKTHRASDNDPRMVWLEEQARRIHRDPEHRFFLFAHYYDVHSDSGTEVPYGAPPAFRREFFPEGFSWRRSGDIRLLVQLERAGSVTEEDLTVINGLYDAGVLFTDRERLGRLLAKLRQLGLFDDSLIVVTSDHGEEIFEHAMCSHQQPYEETARVPLVMHGPGIPQGLRIPDLTELVDLMPTLLSLLGLPIPEHVQGRDLTPLLRGEPLSPAAVHVDGILGGVPHQWRYTPSGLIREVNGRRWSYVNTVEVSEAAGQRVYETRDPGELYLLEADPDQQHNVISEHPVLASEMRAQLLAWYGENEARASALGEAEVDAEMLSRREYDRLKALGYVQE